MGVFQRYSAAMLLSLATGAMAAPGDVLWIDDFSSGSVNTDYWSYDMGTGEYGWGNKQLEYYTDSTANVNVTNGQLLITAIRNTEDPIFTSGRIKTEGKVQFQYGRLEASIKVPNVADGLWPAFWTMGSNFNQVGWPAASEVDIMELGQGLAITEGVVNKRVVSGAHWENEDKYVTYATHKDFSTDLYLDYHNYTLDWTPSRMATFVDGEVVWEMDISESSCTDCTEFHQPHFFLLNLAVGGYFTSVGGEGSSGASSSSSSAADCAGSSSAGDGSSSSGGCFEARTDVTAPLPATMYVDYVQIVDNGYARLVTPSPPPTPPPTPNIFEGGEIAPMPTSAPEVAGGALPPVEPGFTVPEYPPDESGAIDTEIPPQTGEVPGVPDDSIECMEEASGKGKGKGTGDSRRGRARGRRGRRLCGKSSKSGKGGKGGKGGKAERSDEMLSTKEASLYSATPSTNNVQLNSLISNGPVLMAVLWTVLAL